MKTSYTCLIKMADNAMWAQRIWRELGRTDLALKYALIWCRIMKAANQLAYDKCFGHMAEFRGMGI